MSVPKPRYDWPIRMAFRAYNQKPQRRKLPGLCLGPHGQYPNGTRVWAFTLEGMLAN